MNVKKKFTSWEDAVAWLKKEPNYTQLVKDCYYDDSLYKAANRYWNSLEWQSIKDLLPNTIGKALDIGAGNGIASFALAKEGWATTAIEPDPSDTVGCGAIKKLAIESELTIKIIQAIGEKLPLPDETFNVVLARQVLHHANDLEKLCIELFRILKPGGMLIATREHVISGPKQLPCFLEQHPLHKLYGGENAYMLKEYKSALTSAGFLLVKTLGPFDSVINYAPFSNETLKDKLSQKIKKIPFGNIYAKILLNDLLFKKSMRLLSIVDRRPGRLFTFVAHKSAL